MRKIPLWSIALLASAPLAALAQVPAGGEFRANTYTLDDQFKASVNSTPTGSFVIVWQSYGQDGDRSGVFGQRYDSRGVAVGGEFQANTYTTGLQGAFPPLGFGMDRKGNFVVTWPTFGEDGSQFGGSGQRFTSTGLRAGGEFIVNSYTTGLQGFYGAAMGANGQFVVTWIDPREGSLYGVFARRFDAAGVAQGEEFLVNSTTSGPQIAPDVAVAPNGGFVVVFRGPGSGFEVFGRRFDPSGNALGLDFQVNTYTTDTQSNAQVDMAPDGSFVVVWDGDDTGGSGIFARRFDPSGNALGAEFRVSNATTYSFLPAVALDAAGRFVVAWTDLPGDGASYGVQARRFDANGVPRGVQFQVNSQTSGTQYRPSVASDAVGNFVVSWVSNSSDGDGASAEGRRFGGLQPAALAVVDGGNGVLEVADTFTLGTSWRNVNGLAQTFQGTSSGIVAPAGLTMTLSPDANYGTVANGATGACNAPCFAGGLTGTRPIGHADVSFQESILPDAQGQAQRWRLHVGDSFTDVPRQNPYYRFVETLLHYGVTGGCSPTGYCGASSATREQMAVFVLVAKEGAGYAPAACTTSIFNDVPAASPFCRFIEELSRRGVVSGCGGDNYCPGDAVTREQMAIFALRTLDPALDPPACTMPMFADVPASSPFCRWIEELARRGVVSGCGGGNYCPTLPVTREQMGVFISATFGLTLYGP